MKNFKKFIFATLLLSLPLVVAARKSDARDDGKKGEHVFVLKADKKFLGAKVEIFSASGNLITAQTLDKRKIMVDFADVKAGLYTIKLTSGENSQEFKFKNK